MHLPPWTTPKVWPAEQHTDHRRGGRSALCVCARWCGTLTDGGMQHDVLNEDFYFGQLLHFLLTTQQRFRNI